MASTPQIKSWNHFWQALVWFPCDLRVLSLLKRAEKVLTRTLRYVLFSMDELCILRSN